MSWACGLFGHQPVFRADGVTMRWACQRCGGDAGAKDYDTATDASRYAAAFNRRDTAQSGHHAPMIGLLPLRLWQRFRRN